MEQLSTGIIAALAGLGVGTILGLAARFGGFGTLSALRAAMELGDQRRIRLWALVIGVAMIVTHALASFGHVRVEATIYQNMAWVPVATIAGGLFFGYGMAVAGSCGFEALVRVGAGDLRALVIPAIIGISAMALQTGPISVLRELLLPPVPSSGPQTLSGWLSAQSDLSPFLFSLVFGGLLITVALSYRPLRMSRARILWGIAVGLAVAAAFAMTTWLHENTLGRVPVDGPAFTLSLGQSILFLMTPADHGTTFGAGLVGGVLLGAITGAFARGFFTAHHAEANPNLGRMAGGAVMMGIGGGLALGDIIGQGISGMAVLAWSAPVMIASCLAGCFLGRRWLLDYEYRNPADIEDEAH
jgi:hypothetical protein